MTAYYLTGPAGDYKLANGLTVAFPGTGIVWDAAIAAELETLGLTVVAPPASDKAEESEDPTADLAQAEAIDAPVDEELTEDLETAGPIDELADPPTATMTTASFGETAAKSKPRNRRK